MKGKKITAVLCVLAVVSASAGGLPLNGDWSEDMAVTASAAPPIGEVIYAPDLYIAGNGSNERGSWVNGESWNAGAASNKMSYDEEYYLYSISYQNVPAGDDYEFKFAQNGSWDVSYGYSSTASVALNEWHDIGTSSGEDTNIRFDLTADSDLTIEWDLDAVKFRISATPIVSDPTYTITIPESVNIDGGTAQFKAENVTLPDGAKINITVDGENTEAGAATFNAKNEAKDSTVQYTIKNGDATIADGGTALTFTGNGTQTLTFAKKADSTPTYAGTHTETLTFGVKLEDPNAPKIYNKNSENITDGVVLENVGDTIDTTDTLKYLRFNTSAKMDFKIDGNDETMVFNFQPNAQINGVESMYLDDNRDFICVTSTGKGKLIPDEGKQFRVKYNLEDNRWIIDQI